MQSSTALPAGTPVHPPATGRRVVALIALSLTFGLVQLDATIVNVALPTLHRELGGGIGGAQWVVDGYAVPFAACMLAAGAVGDRVGHRPGCLIGFGIFAVASVLAGLPGLTGFLRLSEISGSWPILIAGRVLQGVGAALMLPASLAMIGQLYPDPRSRSRALGVWGGVATSGFAAGPVVGGLLITHAGWPSIFLINIPVAVVIGAVIMVTAPVDAHQERRLDPLGTVLGVVTLGAFTGAVIEAGQRHIIATVVLVLLATVCGAIFLAVERHSASPTFPTALLRPPEFRWALLCGLGFNFAMYGALLCVSLLLQDHLGFSALAGGLAVLPMAIVVSVGATCSGFLAARLGPRRPMMAGFIIAAAGSVLIAIGAWSDSATMIVIGVTVIGLCSLAMPAMTSVALNAAPSMYAGLASGALNTTRQLGGAIGVAALGSLLNAVGFHVGATLALALAAAVCGLAVLSTIKATARWGQEE